jgi:hypothetical protein
MGLSGTSEGGTSPVRSSGSARAIIAINGGRESRTSSRKKPSSSQTQQASAAHGARRGGRINARAVRDGRAGMPRLLGRTGLPRPPQHDRKGQEERGKAPPPPPPPSLSLSLFERARKVVGEARWKRARRDGVLGVGRGVGVAGWGKGDRGLCV